MTEWWRGAVMYQIYPRSYYDANGDGIGDLAGIEAKMDYIASLGVDGIWLSPFFKSPMADFGYDVSDYCDVDPIFGNLADFDRMLAAAHARGLRVIIDMVVSHTSDRHPWFIESRANRENPKADWYVWASAKPDGTPPNNWLAVFGGSSWQWDTRRCQYYLHNFLVSQPDLNLHNPEVVSAVFGEMEFWLKRGVDGFRLDTSNFYLHDPELRDNPPRDPGEPLPADLAPANPYSMQRHVYDKSRPENLDFLRKMRRLMDRYPESMTVAEVACDTGVQRLAEYVGAPDLLHTAYSFDLLGRNFSAAGIRRAVESFFAQPGEGWPSWAFSNHDVERAVSRWGGKEAPPAFAKVLIAALCALPGTPFIYQGEELGLPEADVPFELLQDPYGIAFWPEIKGRDGCRTPMPWQSSAEAAGFSNAAAGGQAKPWLPVPDAHQRRAVDAAEKDPGSVLAFTRAYLRWRRTQPVLRQGKGEFIEAPEPALAWIRRGDAGAVLCAFNLGRDEARIALPPGLRVTALEGHGLAGDVSESSLVLPGYGGFFGTVG